MTLTLALSVIASIPHDIRARASGAVHPVGPPMMTDQVGGSHGITAV